MTVAAPSRADDRRHVGLIAGVAFQPVFILGDHRSGTTLLYQLLARAERFNVVQAYHLIRYDGVLDDHLAGRAGEARRELAEQFRRLGLTDRLLDGVPVSPELPEEYGFRLADEFRPKLSPQNLPRLVELCRKVQWVSDPGRPLLLKNPWDYANFLYLKEAFPEARFIFLHRHPLQVISSQIRAARQLYGVRSPYHALLNGAYARVWGQPLRRRLIQWMFSPRFGLGVRVATRHVARAAAYFVEHIGSLPETDYVEVKFEAVCADPGRAVATILAFLQFAPQAGGDYAGLIEPRSSPLLPEVQQSAPAIARRLRRYLEHCRY
jgi:hypothetical protein